MPFGIAYAACNTYLPLVRVYIYNTLAIAIAIAHTAWDDFFEPIFSKTRGGAQNETVAVEKSRQDIPVYRHVGRCLHSPRLSRKSASTCVGGGVLYYHPSVIV